MHGINSEASVISKPKAQTGQTPPVWWEVWLLNDDFTPMDFVVHVLQTYFDKDLVHATEIMLQVHHEGRGMAGVYPKDVAQTKASVVMAQANRRGFPLQCTARPSA